MELKEVFKQLKETIEPDITSMFVEFNRRLVNGVATGDAHPRTNDTLKDVLESMKAERADEDDSFHLTEDFVIKAIGEKEYKYYHASVPVYDTEVHYFVSYNEVGETSLAGTILMTKAEGGKHYAAIVVNANHPSVTTDTIGKILKHELTHVALFIINEMENSPLNNIEDEGERISFEEFLCDYIQCELLADPNEDPTVIFEDICEEHFTEEVVKKYQPYIKAVVEYYKDLDNRSAVENTVVTVTE